jgi:peptidoglycan/xylan/chitin deacetylase (PgdA/CDA1 family)
MWNRLSGRAARVLDGRRGTVAILIYHRIVPDAFDVSNVEPGMYVRASAFERHVEWLVGRWPVRTLVDVLARPPRPAEPPVAAVTFDDGWRDNLTVAWPILRKHGVRPTIFLVRDWVRDGRNDEGEFLRPEDVASLAAQGVEFGAHTVTHPRLDRLPPAAVEAEIATSKEAVERWTGQPCRTFAYPFGASSPEAEETARRYFDGAVLAGGGWWTPGRDRSRIPRVAMHNDMASTRSMFETRLAAGATR